MASKALPQRHSQNTMGSPPDSENDLASIELIESGLEEMKGAGEESGSLPTSPTPTKGGSALSAVWSKVESVVHSPRFRPTAKKAVISTAALLCSIPVLGFIVYLIVVQTLTGGWILVSLHGPNFGLLFTCATFHHHSHPFSLLLALPQRPTSRSPNWRSRVSPPPPRAR